MSELQAHREKEHPITYEKACGLIAQASIEWVSKNIHPYVPRNCKDTDRGYFRKMVLFMVSTGAFPGRIKPGKDDE